MVVFRRMVSQEVSTKVTDEDVAQVQDNVLAQGSMRVIVIGGGYGGIAASHELETKGIDVTLIERNAMFFHKIGGSRACVKPGYENVAVIPLNKVLKRKTSTFLQGEVTKVEPSNQSVEVRLPDGSTESVRYDSLVLAMGMKHGYGQLPDQGLSKDEMLSFLRNEQARIAAAHSIVVIGGGALGIESASQIKATHPSKDVQLYHSSTKLLSSAKPAVSDEFSERCKEKMEEMGIKVHLGEGRLSQEEVAKRHPDAIIIFTVGCLPNESTMKMLPRDWLNQNTGEVRVTPALRIEGGPSNVYAIGDVAETGDFKQAKCAHAHARVVVENIMGGSAVYEPRTENPWYSIPLSFILACKGQATRVNSSAHLSLYIGETEGVTEGNGVIFSDEFSRKIIHPDKGVGKARHFLGI